MDCSYQSFIVRFSLGLYCKQERLIQALGNGTLREARPRFSRLAASLLATRALRLLPAINFEEKYYTTLILVSAVSARVLTILFVRSSFSHLLLAHVFLINKKLEKASIRAVYTWNHWSPFLLTHSASEGISYCYSGNSSVHYRPHYKYSQCQSGLRAGSLVRVRGTFLAAEPPSRKGSVKEYCDSFLSLSNLPCISN